MTVQTLRGTGSFPDGRGAVSCRSLVARRRAGAGDDGRRRRARLRGRAGPRARAGARARRPAPAPHPALPPAPAVARARRDEPGLGRRRAVRPRLARAPRRAAGAGRPRRAGRARRAGALAAPGPLAAAVGADRHRGRRRAASASRCWPRCTTRWSTASRRSTSAPCCSTRPRSHSTCRRPTGPGRRGPMTVRAISRACRSSRWCAASGCWPRGRSARWPPPIRAGPPPTCAARPTS